MDDHEFPRSHSTGMSRRGTRLFVLHGSIERGPFNLKSDFSFNIHSN